MYSAEVQAFDEPPWWERNYGAMQRENPTFRHILWSIIAVNTYKTFLLLGISVVAILAVFIQYFDP